MRFDMHCHTKEGSPDGKITLKEYVHRLKELGFDGMLITDHDSYKAYRYYLKNKTDPVFENFTILKGIEYDTCDAGHILVVMPENIRMPILELRGLPVKLLIEIVHAFHGILGPAHPTGEKYLSITNFKIYHRHPEILQEFDFMETYNSCISPEANRRAAALAEQYRLPGTGGSDAHKMDCVGLAFTEFPQPVRTESELIDYLTAGRNFDSAAVPALNPAIAPANTSAGRFSGKPVRQTAARLAADFSARQSGDIGFESLKQASSRSAELPVLTSGGSHYPGSTRDHLGLAYDLLLRLYYVYSKIGNFFKRSKLEGEVVYLLSASNTLFQRIRSMDFLTMLPEKAQKTWQWKEIEDELFTEKSRQA